MVSKKIPRPTQDYSEFELYLIANTSIKLKLSDLIQ